MNGRGNYNAGIAAALTHWRLAALDPTMGLFAFVATTATSSGRGGADIDSMPEFQRWNRRIPLERVFGKGRDPMNHRGILHSPATVAVVLFAAHFGLWLFPPLDRAAWPLVDALALGWLVGALLDFFFGEGKIPLLFVWCRVGIELEQEGLLAKLLERVLFPAYSLWVLASLTLGAPAPWTLVMERMN